MTWDIRELIDSLDGPEEIIVVETIPKDQPYMICAEPTRVSCGSAKIYMKLEGFNYQISQQRQPIYTMGGPSSAFLTGRRSITGTLSKIIFPASFNPTDIDEPAAWSIVIPNKSTIKRPHTQLINVVFTSRGQAVRTSKKVTILSLQFIAENVLHDIQ